MSDTLLTVSECSKITSHSTCGSCTSLSLSVLFHIGTLFKRNIQVSSFLHSHKNIATVLYQDHTMTPSFYLFLENFPPGPLFTLPFIGDKWSIGNITDLSKCARLAHGNIIGYWNRDRLEIMVNTFPILKEVGKKEEFSYR